MNPSICKRSYHPLFQFLFYTGALSNEQIASIPKTTRDYWKLRPHTELYGYSEINFACVDFQHFNTIQKHRIIFRSAIYFCRMAFAFQQIFFQIKGHKRILKDHLALITNTIDYFARELPLNKACKVFNITTTQYYRWKNKLHCSASVLNLCYKTHPRQLTTNECAVIQSDFEKQENIRKSLTTIWYGLLRSGQLYCSKSTFYKYVKLLVVRIRKNKDYPPIQRLKATRIFEYIHLDTTLIPTLKGIVRAVIFKDNYSKKILLQAVVDDARSASILHLVQEVFQTYHLFSHPQPIALVSDGGPENRGELSAWVESLNTTIISKCIARSEGFKFSNNQIESTFNTFKNEFLDKTLIIRDKEHAAQLLSQFQHYHDNERFPVVLYGLSPQEVFEGQLPDPKRFSEQIRLAQTLRYETNKRTENHCQSCILK